MDLITAIIDIALHLDVHLKDLVIEYGTGVYAILFLIVFIETGLVIWPFLPGDSLLFVTGTLPPARALVQSRASGAGARLLRAPRRQDHHPGALHPDHPYLRAIRRGRRRHALPALSRLLHRGGAFVGRLAVPRGLFLRQHPAGQAEPEHRDRADRAGFDLARGHRLAEEPPDGWCRIVVSYLLSAKVRPGTKAEISIDSPEPGGRTCADADRAASGGRSA